MERTGSPPPGRTTAVSGYLVAVLAVSVTSLLREKVRPLLTDHSVFAMDYLAIAFATWYGGFGPGLAAIVTAVPFAMLVIPPVGLAVRGTANVIALFLFVAISTFVAALIESVRRARERAEDARQRALDARRRAEDALEALRESQQKYRGVFTRNLAGVSRTTLDGRILECNRALAKIYGYDAPEDMLAVGAESLHENPGARRAFVDRLRAAGGALVNIEGFGRRRDGSPVWTLESHQIVVEHGEVVIEGSILDISDRKKVEVERERLVDELQEADRRKDEFLAMLAHELRNPLVPIANAVRVLQLPDAGPETLRESLAMIERQLGHMVRLVDDLLDVSRISRGKIEIRKDRFDLAVMTEEVAADFRGELARHGLALETVLPDEPIWIEGDRVRVAEVLTNLLQNARKFTDPGGSIRVRLDEAEGRARLRVLDTGIGIDAAMLPHVFEPFSQADRSIARTRGGLGLGLALVRGIITAHGGEVSASSGGLGRGTELTVLLPVAPRRSPDTRASARRPPVPAPPRRVLVVEDNGPVAEGMRFLLEHLRHDVRVAEDGAAGLETIRHFRPDVVLCDIGLPGEVDGYALARSVRSDAEIAGTCLIAITGYGQASDRDRAREAGFDIHVTKPVNPARLEELLSTLPRAVR